MNYRNASAPARPASRTLAAIGQTAVLTVALALRRAARARAGTGAGAAGAQPPSPKPAAKPKPPAPQHPPPQRRAAPAAQQAPRPGPGQRGDQQVQLIYSPWTKFCLKGNNNDPNAKQVCFTGKDARIESGMPVVAAVLIEPEGEPKKILRVTLPLGMQLVHGTRVIIDQNQPMTAPYVICFTNGCMADYEANADMIGKMKKGQGLVVQAINSTGQPISLVLPLADFAKAYDGPPTDPKVFEEQQKKLQEELQRRADEARKKLESQQGQPQSSNAPPAPQQYAAGYWQTQSAAIQDVDRFARFRPASFADGSRCASVQRRCARAVAALAVLHERLRDLRMAHRLAGRVGQQILLRHIGDVFGFVVLGEQMIERLVLVRPHLGRDRLVPFLGIVEDRIDVEHHAAERIEAVPDDLADLILGDSNLVHCPGEYYSLTGARIATARSPA